MICIVCDYAVNGIIYSFIHTAKCPLLAVFGLLETPADVSGQGYEASSDTVSAEGHPASVSFDASSNRASTSADRSRLGYCTDIYKACPF